MKRILNFTSRNFKELIRDPLSFIFALLLPLFLLWIFPIYIYLVINVMYMQAYS